MNSKSAQELLDSIDKTISDIDTISGSNPLKDSYLAKFLVVYICGIYEEVIENILIDFTSKNTARSEIISYVEESVDISFRNPDFDKIISLISRLKNSLWITELNKMKSSAGTALDSIVTNKNGIAHGQSITITLSEIKQYYLNSRPFVEKIDFLLL